MNLADPFDIAQPSRTELLFRTLITSLSFAAVKFWLRFQPAAVGNDVHGLIGYNASFMSRFVPVVTIFMDLSAKNFMKNINNKN